MLRVALLCLALLVGLLPSGVVRADGEERQEEPPIPEANFAGTAVPRPCTAQEGNPYEAEQYQDERWSPDKGRYPGDCQRLRFSFGPIHVKPGQNDVLLEPVTIEKPAYDGYAVRFRPELVYADGTVPSMHDIHLHHAVWLNIFGNYGNGEPFFAAGEEKTIINLPGSADSEEPSFGMPVKATDTWQILYMIHNEQIEPTEVFLVYEVDFVPEKAAEEKWDIQPVYPVWLDVRPSIYPVFNAQRGFGQDLDTDRRVCTWPAENCARFDPWGDVTPHQGGSRPPEVIGECGESVPANCVGLPDPGGSHGRLRDFQGGTLVHVGGHLHPGGLTVDIDLERGADSRRIFTSEAVYWSHQAPHTARDGPPTSWDMAMTVQSLPEWGIEVKPGDVLRINATTDITEQAVYEGMGIAIAWLSPEPQLGVNPFEAEHDKEPNCPSGGLQAETQRQVCERGEVSHGHLEEAEGYGGEGETDFAEELDEEDELDVQEIAIADFLYLPGNMGSVQGTGIPTVELGEDLRFVNLDAAANVYHTITSCKYPCNGAHGTAYPVANGESDSGDPVDFDSGELGYGARLGSEDLGPAKNEADWTLEVRPDGEVGEYEGFEEGVYTFFCRVHPWMQGTFKVKEDTS